ncbi:CCDC90 family protein [Duganella sp. PWIR1]
MNMPIKFDTHEYVRNLIEAGIPADQAEAQAMALSQAMAEATVTPSELVLLRTDMTARIEMLRADIYAKLEALEQRLKAYVDRKLTTVFWMVGISLSLHAVTIGMQMRILDRMP